MQRRTVQWLAIGCIVLVALVLRVYNLKDLPAGLFCDEAALGYNAYSIGTSGVDENGETLPLFIWSFAGYKNPVYIYASIPVVKLLGLDEFSTRLPAALFGVGGIVAMFMLGRAVYGAWVGLFAAAFMAICPWHLHFSRIGFELISFPFLFTVGLTLLVRYTQGRRTLAAGMFFCALCLYAYAISAVFVPLFLLGFSLLYAPTLLRRWKETLLALLVIAATVFPAGYFYHRHPQATGYFRSTTMVRTGHDLRVQVETYLRNYQEFFSPNFLFRNGDQITRHAVRGFGELLPSSLPFMLLGAVVAMIRRDRASKLVLLWLAAYPAGPSLMTEIPTASRGIIGAPAFCLLAGLGLAAGLRALGWVARWRPLALVAQTAAVAAAGYFLVPEFVRYWREYSEVYPKYSAPTYGGFQFGYRDTIQYMESQRANFDLLMLTAVEVNQPQIFPVFYNANTKDPAVWAKSTHSPLDLGYLILDPAEQSRYGMDKRILYQLRPSDLYYFTDYTIHRRITAPNGVDEFVVAEVRARKRFLTNWMVLGLFPNDAGAGERRDFIDVTKISKDRAPGTLGDGYWRPIVPQFVRVDLNQFYAASDPRHPGNPEEVCAYPAMTVRAAKDVNAWLELAGSRDSIEAWLNGRRLTPGPMFLDETPKRRPIEIVAGDNLLVLKSCEGIGSWEFTARITDEKGLDTPDLTLLPELPKNPPAAATRPAGEALQIVEGFDSVVSFKHTQNPYPDYRGGTESWWANLLDAQSELVWRTAPVPQKQRTILAFTFSMSEGPGEIELYVDGKYALNFEVGDNRTTNSWQRGPYQLTFIQKAVAAGNSGIMLLSVPEEDVNPGAPMEIRLLPVRGPEGPWVMIKGYRDTVTKEGLTPEIAAELMTSRWETGRRE